MLKDTIKADMIAAMKGQDKETLGTIRLLTAAIKQKEIDEQVTLDDAGVVGVINKMIKQRRDSITQYQAGHRQDLADKEQAEIKVLEKYLPQQLSEAEIAQAVAAAIKSTGASSVKDMGKVMGALKTELAGKADMGVVSTQVKAQLGA